MNLDAIYLVKVISEKYIYFDSNYITVLLQLLLYLDAYRVPVCEGVKSEKKSKSGEPLKV